MWFTTIPVRVAGSGPTLSFRGIDNLAYYRTDPENPGHYINDTGCGNTLRRRSSAGSGSW